MKKVKLMTLVTLLIVGFVSFQSCKDDDATVTPTENGDTTELPAVYSKIYGATDIYVEGNFVVVKVNSLPDHPSPYYQNTQWSAKYEAYNGSNSAFNLNPNRISETNYTYKIPLNPIELSSGNQATNLGTMGVAINGVPLFNQYAGPNEQELTNEINSFDQYYGHPQQQGVYHYHIEPLYLTANKGKDALMGFLLDGFPVYGPEEDGSTVLNSDLDVFHGHNHATVDYPDGIYHYHITDAAPYINGDGFKGTPGTATQ
ncbi:MAG: YHYH protein [Bacteroidetes bacterium]|nr:MAG: YHYH protein [Bacteroidota bacterium]